MSNPYKTIISPKELKSIINNENIRIYDVRTGPNAHKNYIDKHISKANFVSLDHDLADIKDFKEGGRHPLPDINQFIKTIEGLGISQESEVIIYDDKNGANAAARFWWMLKAIGHQNVQILDGGLQNAIANNLPTTSGKENYKPANYPQKENWTLPTTNIDLVEKASKSTDHTIVDVREDFRYNGIKEPIDLVAGHIPNAINIPFSGNLDDNGVFLDAATLKSKYKDLFNQYESQNITVHCGSGVTACHTILAMHIAGYDFPSLYVGSWSEWSRNKL